MIKYLEPILMAVITGYLILFAAHVWDYSLLCYVNRSPGLAIKQLPCQRTTCECGCEDKQPCRCAAE